MSKTRVIGVLEPGIHYTGSTQVFQTLWKGVAERIERFADIGEFMDYNAQGFYPVDLTNEAYKIGVDFIMYAITH